MLVDAAMTTTSMPSLPDACVWLKVKYHEPEYDPPIFVLLVFPCSTKAIDYPVWLQQPWLMPIF